MGSEDGVRKTLLVVTQAFHPAKSVGAVRISEWARHLPAFGWRTVVATGPVEGRERNPFDECVVHELSSRAGALVTSAPLRGGVRGRVRRLLRRGARLTLIPDAAVITYRRAHSELTRLADEYAADVVLTSGPPHSIHVAGLALTRARDLPWVMDVRDPFLDDSRFRPRGLLRLRMRAFEEYDRSVYGNATRVVHAHAGQRAATVSRLALDPTKNVVITNGFDVSLLEAALSNVTPAPAGRVVVTGTISGQSLHRLERALDLLDHRSAGAELRIAGRAQETRRAARTRLLGWLSPAEVAAEMAAASVLVSALDPERAQMGGLSMKLFGYLASGRPIIAINPCPADTALLEGRSGVVTLVRPSDGEIAEALRSTMAGAVRRDPHDVVAARQEFDNRFLTSRLAHLLDEIVKGQ